MQVFIRFLASFPPLPRGCPSLYLHHGSLISFQFYIKPKRDLDIHTEPDFQRTQTLLDFPDLGNLGSWRLGAVTLMEWLIGCLISGGLSWFLRNTKRYWKKGWEENGFSNHALVLTEAQFFQLPMFGGQLWSLRVLTSHRSMIPEAWSRDLEFWAPRKALHWRPKF